MEDSLSIILAEKPKFFNFVPPPTPKEIDQRQKLFQMNEIRKELQSEINDAFPNYGKSRYRNVYVLLIRWAREESSLPVSLELNELCDVFASDYGFNTETWTIPENDCHNELSRKILDFIGIGNDNRHDLKIVYYAGHGLLTKGRQPAWANTSDPKNKAYRQLKWAGIQNTLEEARSDVLIILDCCASGTANTDDGKGITELVAACGFNVSAFPVGIHSFTRALITELRLLSGTPCFTISMLYNNILSRIQKWMPERQELLKPPLHVLLTQDRDLPRGIQLFPQRDKSPHTSNSTISASDPAELINLSTAIGQGKAMIAPEVNLSNMSAAFLTQGLSSKDEPPRLDLNIWLRKTTPLTDFPIEVFGDWLRMMPVLVEQVRIDPGTIDICNLLKFIQNDLLREIRQDNRKSIEDIKKEIALTQETLSTASVMIDSIDQQRDQSQAAAEKLEKTVSNGFEAVVREIGKQGERAIESTTELSNKVAAGLTAVVEEVGKQGREVAASSQRMGEICTTTVEKTVQELQTWRVNFDETASLNLEKIFQGMEKLHKENDQATPGWYFKNSWQDCFFTHPDPKGKDDIRVVDAKKSFGDIEEKLASFLGLEYPREVDEVKRYCKGGASLEEVQDGIGEAGMRRAVWIDDRNSPNLTGSGNARPRGELLTATELLRYLKEPRYKHEDQPDAERRLIYVSDLTPDIILALAVTAPYLQVPALLDTMYKHISLLSSIRVHVPSDELPSFQMEFHLPFFALRKATASKASALRVRGKWLRDWEELTLLIPDKTLPESQEIYHLYQAQISCVVYGFNEWQWTAYAFEDTQHDSNYDDDEVANDRELDKDAATRAIDEDDPILCRPTVLKPIWRPRQYFLKAFETRIRKHLEEWDELVHRLEVDWKEYIQLHPFISSKTSRSRKGCVKEMKISFHWTRQRIDLLAKLLRVLSGTIREWNTFISLDGGLGYFSDLEKPPSNSLEIPHPDHAGQSLRSIKQTFDKLENKKQRLISFQEKLSSGLEMYKLLLCLEGNAAVENAKFLSNFTIWIMYPFTFAAAIFSMRPEVTPFDFTRKSFIITPLIIMCTISVIYLVMVRWSSSRSSFVL